MASFAGKTVWSIPECFECEVLQKLLYKCTYLYNKIKSDGGLSRLFLFPSFLPFCVFPFLNLNPYVAVDGAIHLLARWCKRRVEPGCSVVRFSFTYDTCSTFRCCCLGFLCCHLVVVVFVLLVPTKSLVISTIPVFCTSQMTGWKVGLENDV